MNFLKYSLNINFWKFFPLFIFIFNPKIDIISIPGFWQGVRIDDIIIFFYLIYYFFAHKFKIIPNLVNKEIVGYNWIVFFPYIILSTIIGKLFAFEPQLIVLARYLEYIALIIIINQIEPSKHKILLLFKIYILLNFIVVLLQYFELIGGFTSKGHCIKDQYAVNYYCFDREDIKSICLFNCNLDFVKNYVQPGGFLKNRSPGITGGPWELTFNLSLCIFALAKFENNWKKLLPYFIMVVLMMLISQSRGIIFGFLIASLFISNNYKKTFYLFLSIIFFILIIYFSNLFNFKNIINEKFFINYFELFEIILGALTNNLPPESRFDGTGLYSMWIRAEGWAEAIENMKSSIILFLFGSGTYTIYTESLIVRIITSFGIVGTLVVLYLARSLPFILIIFLLITGITIDMFINFKIFLFILFFLIVYKKNIRLMN